LVYPLGGRKMIETDRSKLMKESEEAYIRELQEELTRRRKRKVPCTIDRLIEEFLEKKKYSWWAPARHGMESLKFWKELLESNWSSDEIITQALGEVVDRLKTKAKITFNNRVLFLERKDTSKGARRYFIDDTQYKKEDLVNIMKEYFEGSSLPQKKLQGLSPEARKMIQEGLKGELMDLEGKIPFKVDVSYKDGKWYITYQGKSYYVSGGFSSLKKVESALQGRGRFGWDDSRYTRHVLTRLSEIIGEKDALELIHKIKKMGKLFSHLKS